MRARDGGKGTLGEGSIYDGFSPRGQRALGELCSEFRAAGFYAEKERRTERSLRVYPERRWRYPLLNPFFVRARRDSPVPLGGPSVLCPIYSDGDALITRLLETLPEIRGCSYVAARPRRGGRYFLHGHLVIPIVLAEPASARRIDFTPMRPTLGALHLQLSRAGF